MDQVIAGAYELQSLVLSVSFLDLRTLCCNLPLCCAAEPTKLPRLYQTRLCCGQGLPLQLNKTTRTLST